LVSCSFHGVSNPEALFGGIPDWKLLGKGKLPAQHLSGFAGEPEIVVGRHALIIAQFGSGWWIIGTLENGSAFVHFVEHGHIEHFRAGLDGPADLTPIKCAFLAWNLIKALALSRMDPALLIKTDPFVGACFLSK
jgi:hypothetical protein